MEQYAEIVKHVESSFCEPDYVSVQIRYVTNKEDADVCVSKNHSLGDYIVLGSLALFNSVTSKKSEIKVFNQSNLKEEVIGIWHGGFYKDLTVDSELFLQMIEPLNVVYDSLYQNACKPLGIGLLISTLIMTQLTGSTVIPEEIINEVVFEHFDDTITAQKNIFTLMKRITAASVAGMYYNWKNGDIY